MTKEILKYRTDAISKDMDTFKEFVRACHKSMNYSGPSLYFHFQTIEKYRQIKDYDNLLSCNQYLEYLYATLTAWGMHRMTKNVLMKEYKDFKDTIKSNRGHLKELNKYKLETIQNIEDIKDPLLKVFYELKVMEKGTKIVGNSKALHHLLPDLIPPIDRRNTINFFYEDPLKPPNKGVSISKDHEEKYFLEIMSEYIDITKRLNLTLNSFQDKDKCFDTSVPKIIDNAIIGFIQKKEGKV